MDGARATDALQTPARGLDVSTTNFYRTHVASLSDTCPIDDCPQSLAAWNFNTSFSDGAPSLADSGGRPSWTIANRGEGSPLGRVRKASAVFARSDLHARLATFIARRRASATLRSKSACMCIQNCGVVLKC